MIATSSKSQSVFRTQDDSLEGIASSYSIPERTGSGPSTKSWLPHGDPRLHPFSSLPVENTGSIAIAYEFFKHVWIPLKQKSQSSSASTTFRAHCQTVLQDGMLFEQMMAYSLLMQNMDKSPKQRMTTSILYHSNRSLIQLRRRLQSPSTDAYLSGAVIMTIVLLIALHHTCADFQPLSVHLQALHQLIDMSVGQHKLEWNGFVEREAKQLDIDWNTPVAIYQPAQGREQCSPTYPDHPFSSTICHRIAKFNYGFCELALRRKVSLQFIHVLEVVLDMAQDQDTPKAFSPVYGVIEDLITRPELPTLERVLSVALLVYCLSAAQAQRTIPPILEFSIQAHARSFPPGRTISGGESLEEEALDWAALVLWFNIEEGSIAWTWANKRMRQLPEGLFTESYQCKLQESFLFTSCCDLV